MQSWLQQLFRTLPGQLSWQRFFAANNDKQTGKLEWYLRFPWSYQGKWRLSDGGLAYEGVPKYFDQESSCFILASCRLHKQVLEKKHSQFFFSSQMSVKREKPKQPL